MPPLQITYRIESKVARGEAVSGRDLNYKLPPISVRLMSIVPEDTTDIREAPASAFSAIEARESRADLFRLIGTILFALAGVMLLVMVVNLFRQRKVRTPVDTWQSSARSIAAACSASWPTCSSRAAAAGIRELAGRALSATRIAALRWSAGGPSARRASGPRRSPSTASCG